MKEANFIKYVYFSFCGTNGVCKKRGRYLRVMIHFQIINKNIIIDAYLLHKIDEQIDRMRGNTWFTALVLTKGYHQMNLVISSLEIHHLQRLWDFILGKSCLGYEDFQSHLSTFNDFVLGDLQPKKMWCVLIIS